MKETWLPIPGYIGRYAISDFGNVLSMDYGRTGLIKLLQPSVGSGGYTTVGLAKGNKCITHPVHRLVALAFLGPRPKDYQINHRNGIKADCRLSNLEYCTAGENNQHAYDTGLKVAAHGETHYLAKLNPAKVIEIRKKLDAGLSQSVIAKEYDVKRETIRQIAHGKTWKHVSIETLQ